MKSLNTCRRSPARLARRREHHEVRALGRPNRTIIEAATRHPHSPLHTQQKHRRTRPVQRQARFGFNSHTRDPRRLPPSV